MCIFLVTDINSTTFWRYPFNCVCNPKQLVEYVVMDIEPIMEKERKTFPGQGTISNKHMLSDVWLVRASELGTNDNTIHARTHLGHVLKVGDSALGYNIEDSNINDGNFNGLDSSKIPDVILVKKYYGNRMDRLKKRNWKLKHLAEENMAINPDAKYEFSAGLFYVSNSLFYSDYDEFLNDLEEDPDFRQNVNIYKKNAADEIAVDSDSEVDPTMPRITLAEMLDDLQIEDVEMAE